MSKWILYNRDVINIIVAKVVGSHAVDEYTAKLPESVNFRKPDVIYIADEATENKTYKMPPILIDIQYTASMSFYKSLIDYSLLVEKEYNAEPIVITIVIHNTTKDLSKLAAESDTLPFFKALPCFGWAESFNLMNADSIHDHIKNDVMEPLVALGYFIIQQKLSLEEIEKKDDPTIKMLYKISQDAFGEIYREETISKRVEDICSQTYDIIKSAKRTLAKDVREEVQRKRTADILDSGLETIQELRRKHSVIYTSGKRQRLSDEDGDDLDWKFVQTFKQEHVGRMDWKLCFQFGKEKNLFSKYSSSQSLRSAFNRHCKK